MFVCRATRDALLPLEFPVRSVSGEIVNAVHVPAGTNIIMSILGANRNERPEDIITTTELADYRRCSSPLTTSRTRS